MLLKLEFYVPSTHLKEVNHALFNAGAGHLGQYKACAWYTKGTGQFMPMEGSHPFIGETEKLEQVEEYKVEMVLESQYRQVTIDALKKAHPYETVAYQLIEILTL